MIREVSVNRCADTTSACSFLTTPSLWSRPFYGVGTCIFASIERSLTQKSHKSAVRAGNLGGGLTELLRTRLSEKH